MKVKSDFITNSSSTSYVICLPDKITDELLEKLFEKVIDNGDDELNDEDQLLEERKDEIKNWIKCLEAGKELWREEDPSIFDSLTKLAEEQDWIIDEKDTSSEAGQITALSKKDLEKIKRIKGI